MASRQADKPADERVMSKVRKNQLKGGQGGRREASLFRLQGEHTYPVRLNQSRGVKEGGWGGAGQEGWDRMGWAKGRKRQDEEGKRIRLRQSEQL